MQCEIYVIKTEIIGNKAQIEALEKIKDEISLKIGGITVLPIIQGEWFENGKKYVDNGEIWRICASNDKPIDFIWLNQKIVEIKALTLQKSQLMTASPKTSAYFF